MTLPNPALNSLNPRLFQIAFTPFGSTPPLDHNARRILDISSGTHIPPALIGQAFGLTALLTIAAHLVFEAPPTWLLAICLVPLGLLLWVRMCWQIRRLRDAGKPIVCAFLPALVWPAQFILPILAAIMIGTVFNRLDVGVEWQTPAVLGTALATWLAILLIVLPRHRRWWRRQMNAPSITR